MYKRQPLSLSPPTTKAPGSGIGLGGIIFGGIIFVLYLVLSSDNPVATASIFAVIGAFIGLTLWIFARIEKRRLPEVQSVKPKLKLREQGDSQKPVEQRNQFAATAVKVSDIGKRVTIANWTVERVLTVKKVLKRTEYEELRRGMDPHHVSDREHSSDGEFFLGEDSNGEQHICACDGGWVHLDSDTTDIATEGATECPT